MDEETICIVEKARDGDSDAVSRLYELYRLRVARFCLSFAGIEQADANDITQDVFVRTFLGIRQLRDAGRFEGWLYSITRSRCMTFLSGVTKRNKRLERYGNERVHHKVEEQMDEIMRDAEKKIVLEEIERLADSSLKEAGKRYYVQGQDTSKIAQELSVPVSTVTTWLSRFRGKIRKRLLVRVLELRGHGVVQS